MSINSQRFARATLALGSLIVGWVCGYGYFALVMIYLSDWGRVTDGSAIAAWTAIFVAIGWLLFAVPVAVLADPRRRVFSLWLCPLFGAAYGLFAFLVLAGWMGFWKHPVYLGYPVVIGGIAGAVYAFGLRFFQLRPREAAARAIVGRVSRD